MSTSGDAPSVPDDDPTIADSDTLLRRIPSWPMLITREADGHLRPSSAALELREGEVGCSVDVLARIADPDNPVSVMDDQDAGWGLASCTAGQARDGGHHHVVGDAVEEKDTVVNPAHALIVPTATSRKAQKRNFKRLAKAMTFIRDPQLPDTDRPSK